MKHILAALLMTASVSIVASAQTIISSRTETISLKSYRAFCEGVVPKKCLVVRREGEEDFRTIFDEIENFDFVPGYEYVLRVRVDKLAATPKDTSGLLYYLKEVVSREEVSGGDRAVYLFGNKWRLSKIGGKPAESSFAFVVFTGPDSAVYGNTGCNSFRGTYRLSGDSLQVSPPAVTRRACIDTDEDEVGFADALSSADSIKVEPDRLYLTAKGRTVLEFRSND